MEGPIKTLEDKLWVLANNALESPQLKPEFQQLMSRFRTTKEDIRKAVIEYTFSQTLTNEFFDSMAARFALHLHNHIPGSYHPRRQQLVAEFLTDSQGTAIDVGFGVPGPYVFEVTKRKQDLQLILADKSTTAMDFAKALFKTRGLEFPSNHARFDFLNMNGRLPGRYDNYLFLDSIEHADNPTSYLTKTVAKAPNHAQFVFALPVCDRESVKSVHSIEWRSQEEAIYWLNYCGLKVEKSKLITPNRDVDIFAFIYDRNFQNLIAKCKKDVEK